MVFKYRNNDRLVGKRAIALTPPSGAPLTQQLKVSAQPSREPWDPIPTFELAIPVPSPEKCKVTGNQSEQGGGSFPAIGPVPWGRGVQCSLPGAPSSPGNAPVVQALLATHDDVEPAAQVVGFHVHDLGRQSIMASLPLSLHGNWGQWAGDRHRSPRPRP